MLSDNKPLYTLTIGEFKILFKELIDESVNKRDRIETLLGEVNIDAEHFTIQELSVFLHCSKVSIHNYKKMGMPFYRIGRKILFKKQEVLNFMKGIKSKRVIIDSNK